MFKNKGQIKKGLRKVFVSEGAEGKGQTYLGS